MKILMSYSLGNQVSTVVHTCSPAEIEDGMLDTRSGRIAAADDILSVGYMLSNGDIWNGQPVTDQEADHFIHPVTVSFIED